MKFFFLSLLFVSSTSFAQTIEFIVSATPGGPMDTATRKIAEKIESATDLKIVVMNKPGAGHVIAYNHIENTNKPSLLLVTPEIVAHDVYSQVDQIHTIGYFSNILYVSKKSNITSFRQLMDLAKTREIIFGHGGIGSYSHNAMQIVCKSTLRCLDVSYKSGNQGMLALLTGEIDSFAIMSYGTKQFADNPAYVPIHVIRYDKDASWLKMISKNVSSKDKETILKVLKSQDSRFYNDMGFEK
jgi:tripartite-type tricarboxylate transporter receptor subunit TctC